MKKSWLISRRTLLQTAGSAIALPVLEAMIKPGARAAQDPPRRFLAVQAQHYGYVGRLDPELAILYQAEGTRYGPMYVPPWSAQASGYNVPLENNTHLRPFFDKKINSKITVVNGLVDRILRGTHDAPVKLVANTFPKAGYVTGGEGLVAGQGDFVGPPPQPDPFKGATADQIAAMHLGKNTYLPSLTMGMYRSLGAPERGFVMSYKSASQPIPYDFDPQNIFKRLFAGYDPTATIEELERRTLYRKSILDSVRQQSATLRNRLGRTDQQKLDEYLDGVRSLERRIAQLGGPQPIMTPPGPESAYGGIPNRDLYQNVMQDLIVQAFLTDRTRVVAFATQYAYGFLKYRGIGQESFDYSKYKQFNGRAFDWSQHEASHHDQSGIKDAAGKDVPPTPEVTANKKDYMEIFTHWQLEHFADLLAKLDAQMDIDGKSTVLDNTVALYGGDNGESALHSKGSIPCVLGGRGGATAAGWRIKSGRQLKFATSERSWKDLLWGLMNIVGVPDADGSPRLKSFGYATNPVDVELGA